MLVHIKNTRGKLTGVSAVSDSMLLSPLKRWLISWVPWNDRQMSTGDAGTVLRAGDFDELMLVLWMMLCCWLHPQKGSVFKVLVCAGAFCSCQAFLMATFLLRKLWEPRYLAMTKTNNFKSPTTLRTLALSLERRLLIYHGRKSSS